MIINLNNSYKVNEYEICYKVLLDLQQIKHLEKLVYKLFIQFIVI